MAHLPGCNCTDCWLIPSNEERWEQEDRKALPSGLDRIQLVVSQEQHEKLKREVAEELERARVERCLDGLNTDLLRQDAEDES